MADTQVVMKVPEEIITAQVHAAVASALMQRGDALVSEFVKAAMLAKRDNYSYSKTIWEETLGQMIRDVAIDEFKKWVEEQRPAIKKAVIEKMSVNSKKIVDSFANTLVDSVTKLHVTLNISDRQ